jgi:hypothetical protein
MASGARRMAGRGRGMAMRAAGKYYIIIDRPRDGIGAKAAVVALLCGLRTLGLAVEEQGKRCERVRQDYGMGTGFEGQEIA